MELAVQVTGSYDHVRAIATIAEANGFGAVGLADHYLNGKSRAEYSQPVYDSLSQAAALARDTSRVGIVTLVSPITFRHPAVYAKTMATIDDLSGGRFALGLGTGWHDDEHSYFGIPYPPLGNRFEMLEDALGYLHAFISTPEQGYAGRHYRFEGFDMHPRVRPDMCLIVGGTGPSKTPRLAGTYAGEFNLAVHDPDVVKHRVAAVRRAAVDAGRDPRSIRFSTAYRMIGGAETAEIDLFLAEWGASRSQTVAEMREHIGNRIPMLTWDQHRERLTDLSRMGFDRAYLKVVVKSARAFAEAAKNLGSSVGGH